MGDPKESDIASIESNPETIVCSSCEEVVDQTEFYRCSSCDNADSPISDVLYCDLCISHHIRKKHGVLDSRGYRPAVCATHRALCSLFCETCQVVFCLKCIDIHCKHDFSAVSKKACEIRKEVFKYLEQFDQLSKPLAERRNDADISLELKTDAFPDLGIENFSRSLCNNFERIVQENSSKWEKSSREPDVIHAIGDRVDSNITTLRSMLTMSDGVFVSQFLNSQRSFDSSIQEQEREIESHGNAKWCRTLDSIINDCINDVVATWNLPAYERRPFRKLTFKGTKTVYLPSQWETFVYDLTSTKNQVSFLYFSQSKDVSISKRWCCSALGNQRFLCKSGNAVALIDDENNCMSFYDVEATKLFGEPRKFSKTLKILGVVDEYNPILVRKRFFFWNETSSYLHSKPYSLYKPVEEWKIPCDSKPKLLKFKDDVLLFVQDDNKVTIYDSKTQLNVQVIPRHHGMSQIDDVVICSRTSALFLDYGNKTVLVCGFTLSHRSILNWQIREVYRWVNDEDFDCMTWDDGKLVGCRSAELFSARLMARH